MQRIAETLTALTVRDKALTRAASGCSSRSEWTCGRRHPMRFP